MDWLGFKIGMGEGFWQGAVPALRPRLGSEYAGAWEVELSTVFPIADPRKRSDHLTTRQDGKLRHTES